jgi:phosphopantothenoylcysteine synthetase/decarboxylase
VAYERAYLVVTGSSAATRAPDLVRGLQTLVREVITLPTPNTERVIGLRELSIVPGNRVVESYFDEAIMPRPPAGLVLVAPCTFNSLNKLASGIADNLALSVVAEAIGRGTPVIVAPSVNEPLLRHPQTARSIATLRSWGVSVIDPQDRGRGPFLATDDVILTEVARLLER